MKTSTSPYICHLFICTKSRSNKRKSCGDGDSTDLQAALKDEVKQRGWKPRVRVSASSCLGVCEAGPNIMIYPQKIWLSSVTLTDLPDIIQLVEEIVASET